MHCEWDTLCREKDMMSVDAKVRAYYSAYKPLKWITYHGVNPAADTLLSYLSHVKDHGLNPRNFYITQIKADLARVRALDFDEANPAGEVIGRLDFYLTKAYYRYAAGMRFGFVNPDRVYNYGTGDGNGNPEVIYDVKSDVCGPNYVKEMDQAIADGTVGALLKNAQPVSPQYYLLQRAYCAGKGDSRLLRINMERLRWRTGEKADGKYVLVNIPAQRLWAVDDKEEGRKVLTMRVCCGSTDSKTPQLDSRIYRVELNPFWIVPRSIIAHGISLSPSYLKRKRMRVINRATGREVSPGSVTKEELMQPDASYLVRQDNGEGNSLGRMIFRFKNNFSIFLHDTSDKNAFDNGSRDVSHGCIRVEKPLELAVFLLPSPDKELENTFRTAISRPNPKGEDGSALPLRSTYQSYNPPVQLFIHYYTLYPNPQDNTLHTYPDIYGLDEKVWGKLRQW